MARLTRRRQVFLGCVLLVVVAFRGYVFEVSFPVTTFHNPLKFRHVLVFFSSHLNANYDLASHDVAWWLSPAALYHQRLSVVVVAARGCRRERPRDVVLTQAEPRSPNGHHDEGRDTLATFGRQSAVVECLKLVPPTKHI
jgi:hypothetical protein